jgi:hypothetical protein
VTPTPPASAARTDLTPSRWWMVAAVAVKCLFALLLVAMSLHVVPGTGWLDVLPAPDTFSYLNPAENLLTRGWWVVHPDQVLSQAGRMPGYGLSYLALRLWTSPETARMLLVCAQTVLAGVAVYYLALAAARVLGRDSVFFAVLLVAGAAFFASEWDYRLMTESLASSSAVFYFHQLAQYARDQRRRRLLFAGFWFAYMVFLRPFGAPLLLAAVPFLWPGGEWRRALPRVAGRLLLLASVFAVADGAWIARNYRIFGRVVPLQVNTKAGYNYTLAQVAAFHWLGITGQNPMGEPHSLGAWFRPRLQLPFDRFVFPDYVTTSRCSRADVERARALYDGSYDPDPARAAASDREAAEILDRCRYSFIQEKPWHAYLLAPLRHTRSFLVHAGPTMAPLPAARLLVNDPPLLLLKGYAVFSYWLILVTGIAGIRLVWRRRDWRLWALVSPFFMLVVVFCFYIRHPEVRSLTLGYPSLCVLSALALEDLWARSRSLRRRVGAWLGRPRPLADPPGGAAAGPR